MTVVYPDPFLEVRVEHLELAPLAVTLCSGYDGGIWRGTRLADHLFQWIPYAALSQEHQLAFGSHNFEEMLQLAAAHIYNTKKTESRGELGELLLHLACILHFNTVPVMCKLIMKSSSNDTVKGFDGVHIALKGEEFELWLGESKFYIDPKQALRESVKSIIEHIAPSFLSTEKAMIFGHIGKDVPRREEVQRLFKTQTSGDKLLAMSVFPVLIAYESGAVSSFKEISEGYVGALKEEVSELRGYFCEKAKDLKLRFQLIFVPLGNKDDVVKRFDKKLEAFL